jgi:hypothetical protein
MAHHCREERYFSRKMSIKDSTTSSPPEKKATNQKNKYKENSSAYDYLFL